MREIKFRAWDKEDKKMVEFNRMTFYPNIGWSYCANCGLHIGIHPSHFELMQYTGLKDKNGREIYEGDIFSIPPDKFHHNEERNIVEYVLGIYSLEDHGLHLNDWHERGEVIGNIYENPELFEALK